MTEADFRELLADIPERAPDSVGLHAVRRKNELRAMAEAHLDGGIIHIVRFEGSVPYDVRSYDVVLAAPHLICESLPRFAPGPEELLATLSELHTFSSVRVQNSLPVRIVLDPAHPTRSCPPGIYLLEHRVWAPWARERVLRLWGQGPETALPERRRRNRNPPSRKVRSSSSSQTGPATFSTRAACGTCSNLRRDRKPLSRRLSVRRLRSSTSC